MVKRKTNKKKCRAAVRKMRDWIKSKRSIPLKMMLSSLRKKSRGYWNYYGVIANSKMFWHYMQAVAELMFKWLNRRSQRKSYTWAKFQKHWQSDWRIPPPRVMEDRVSQSGPQREMRLV